MFKGIAKLFTGAFHLAGKAGKALSLVGDEAAEGLAKTWGRKSVAEVAELQANYVDDIVRSQMDDIVKKMENGIRSGYGDDLALKLDDAFSGIRSNVNSEINKMREALGRFEPDLMEKMNKSKQAVQEYTTMAKQTVNDNAAHSNARSLLQKEEAVLTDLNSKIVSQQKISDKLVHMRKITDSIDQGNYKYVAEQLYSPGESQEFMTGMIGENATKNVQDLVRQVARSDALESQLLSNPGKFVEQLVEYKLKKPDLADEFLSNPKNIRMLSKINKRWPDLIENMLKSKSSKLPFRQRLTGLTSGQLGKRLGIGAAVAAVPTTIAGAKVYDWFADNEPANVAVHSGGVQGMVTSLKVTGPAIPIITQVNSSLSTMTNISNDTNSKLGDPETAPAATEKFITIMSAEGQKIVGALENWSVVMDNCEDKQQAQATKQSLIQFINSVSTGLSNLPGVVGSSTDEPDATAAPGIANKSRTQTVDTDNVSKVQGFLGIQQTGELNKTTVDMLRQLEQEYQKRSGDDSWKGSFVTDDGQIAPYDNLIKAQQVINKY